MARTSGTRTGNGAGWGGPANGAGSDKPATTFEIGNIYGQGCAPTERSKAKADLSQKMIGVLAEVAINGANESARVIAADKVLDRLEGKPKSATDENPDNTIKIIGGLPE